MSTTSYAMGLTGTLTLDVEVTAPDVDPQITDHIVGLLNEVAEQSAIGYATGHERGEVALKEANQSMFDLGELVQTSYSESFRAAFGDTSVAYTVTIEMMGPEGLFVMGIMSDVNEHLQRQLRYEIGALFPASNVMSMVADLLGGLLDTMPTANQPADDPFADLFGSKKRGRGPFGDLFG